MSLGISILLFNKLYNESTLVRIIFVAFPHYSARRYVSLSVSLQPFKEKNFSSLWAGAFLSSMGFWVQAVGQSWQVLQLTNSALLLGLVTFAATLPNIVLSPFGGVVADRFDRRHLLIWHANHLYDDGNTSWHPYHAARHCRLADFSDSSYQWHVQLGRTTRLASFYRRSCTARAVETGHRLKLSPV